MFAQPQCLWDTCLSKLTRGPPTKGHKKEAEPLPLRAEAQLIYFLGIMHSSFRREKEVEMIIPAPWQDPGICVCKEHVIWQVWGLPRDLICPRTEGLLFTAL